MVYLNNFGNNYLIDLKIHKLPEMWEKMGINTKGIETPNLLVKYTCPAYIDFPIRCSGNIERELLGIQIDSNYQEVYR